MSDLLLSQAKLKAERQALLDKFIAAARGSTNEMVHDVAATIVIEAVYQRFLDRRQALVKLDELYTQARNILGNKYGPLGRRSDPVTLQ
jgi:hypothetical protein